MIAEDYTIKVENLEELIVGNKVPEENETIIEKNANRIISISEKKFQRKPAYFMDQYKLKGNILTHNGGTPISKEDYYKYLNSINKESK